MRRISVLIILVTLNLKSVAFTNDSLTILDYRIDTNVVSGNILGTKFTFTFSFNSNKLDSKKINNSKFFAISLQLLDEHQNPIMSTNEHSKYSVDGLVQLNNFIACADTHQNKLYLFVPHYILKVKEGNHKLLSKLVVSEFDTATARYTKISKCLKGKSTFEFKVNKPTSRHFQIYCSGVRVDSANAGSWDVVSYPDIAYQISLVSSFSESDYVVTSTAMKNARTAAWLDYSKTITISPNDKITISIIDKDALFNDLMGELSMTLDQLIEHSNSAHSLKFGSISDCTLKVKEVIIN